MCPSVLLYPPGDIHGAGPLGTHGCAEIQAPVTPNTLDHYGGGGGSSAGASGKGQQSSPKSKQRKKFDASIVGGVEEWRDNGTLYMKQVLLSCKDGWMDLCTSCVCVPCTQENCTIVFFYFYFTISCDRLQRSPRRRWGRRSDFGWITVLPEEFAGFLLQQQHEQIKSTVAASSARQCHYRTTRRLFILCQIPSA